MDRWKDRSKLALYPYFRDETFYAFSSGKMKKVAFAPKTSDWMDDLAGSRQQDRGETSEH